MGLNSRIRALETLIIKTNNKQRHEQIMALYAQICIGKQFQIDLAKITNSIQLIDLSWVLAICSLKKLTFSNEALLAFKTNLHNKLMNIVCNPLYQFKDELKKISLREVGNIELCSYVISPNAVIRLLLDDDNFSNLCKKPEKPSLSVTNKTIKGKGKKKVVHRLKLLIQKFYTSLDDNCAEAIWKEIKKNKAHYFWIESIAPWTDGRSEALIKWGTGDKSAKSFSQGAFSNYVSALSTGKEKLSKESYDDVYKD
ncbi:hypothetical protein ACFORL_07925 [Legionella dresdenensis]|uniref:Uncharacterized protein n=1 Tax=Legionella dresdenensis TaxID=450200 RepID=A0ABV8CFI5_9GAMM